ncbi:MAG: MATE family efflux transporter, partial [Lachnospiraceae bacterium]|nr:MATE family efflux transporter [Lachnospiraceae bacterium]
AFRIFLSMIVLTCVQKSTSVFLQALGKPVMAMGLSLLRDFVLSVPLTIFLAAEFGVVGALYSAPVADIVSMIAVVIMAMMVWKELKSEERKEQLAA